MTSPKIKIFVYRLLSAMVAVLSVITASETVSYVLISQNITWRDESVTPTPRRATESYASEIPAQPPPRLYQAAAMELRREIGRLSLDHHDLHTLEISKPLSNFRGQVAKWGTDGAKIYSIDLVTDDYGRRLTDTAASKLYNRHIVIMGCSYAYGEAVASNDTLEAHLQYLYPDQKTYNLGYSGYGPHDVLARSLNWNFMSKIEPSKGSAIYLYTDNQLRRSAGVMSIVGIWGNGGAVLDDQGGYIFTSRGSHRTVSKIKTAFFEILQHSYTVRLFHLDWPLLSDWHYDRMAREMKALELLYQKHTSSDNPLIVVFYPEDYVETDIILMKKHLDKHGVKFIDYSAHRMDLRIKDKAGVDYDGHPTGAAYAHLASMLKADLHRYFTSTTKKQN